MKRKIVVAMAIVALAITSGCTTFYGKGKGKAPEPVVITNG